MPNTACMCIYMSCKWNEKLQLGIEVCGQTTAACSCGDLIEELQLDVDTVPSEWRSRMELDSETPCFEKTMTPFRLQKNWTVLIPASFIRTHGHMLDTVISLTGSNGEMRTVEIKKYPRVRGSRDEKELRFFLGHGWKEFAKEKGFQVGDCVLFRLVGNSCFHVLVSSKLRENAAVKTTSLSQNFKERGLDKSGREDDGIIPQTKVARLPHPKVKSARDQARPWRGNNVKEEAAVNNHRRLSETNCVKHPDLEAAISTNSIFPQFTCKLSRINVRAHDPRLEIPLRFAQEYGHKFQERVRLLGLNGQRRVVKIVVFSPFRMPTRVQFCLGWRAFSRDNGFKEGDVLLFSLVEFSQFLVQVFPVATQ